jgi:signal transduction histidine kinase
MCLPIAAHGRALGTVSFMLMRPDRCFGSADLALAQELANCVALHMESSRLYREAERAIQALEGHTQVVSHELRNSLQAILLTTNRMLRTTHPGDPGSNLWQPVLLVQRLAGQMQRLINDLLDLESIAAGRLSLRLGLCDASTIVKDAIEMSGPLAAEKSLQLEWSATGSGVNVLCDRDRVLQVFSNLLRNAIAFTPAGGTIRLRTENRGAEQKFSVSDTGTGIAEDHLPFIFDRFWQAQPGAHQGFGLGLAISKGIVEAHGGRIWAESSLEGGSTFSFTIPVQLQLADQPETGVKEARQLNLWKSTDDKREFRTFRGTPSPSLHIGT